MPTEKQSTGWHAAIWDHPRAGARHYVRRRDTAAYDGWRPASDERGGVLIFDRQKHAQWHAERLNAQEAPDVQ